MKAKELMIGDFVKFHEETIQVTSTLLHLMAVEEDAKCIEPIPITKDILTANGYVIRRGEYCLNCGFLGNDWARSGIEIIFYDRTVINIECNYRGYTNRLHLIAEYVHQLQQAMRLCGLEKFADNFKIE